ncbi:LutC/YkgG family protein [Dictyobacter formicarum]|uniref:LUD domain-containing protein n=1 Tax=Dictyobacter formicarum TaxID=2778368 RepID=A0ABQ3VBC5_9CHLR|nr:lactate utilization protein [Dictyobacter formicarum]GHO82766.1 hypothetical protein KSZ_07720 [Dictyobacter formicarum]
MTKSELFTHFRQRLTAVGGECYWLENLAQAADIIIAHKAFEEKERQIVVPPDFTERLPWEGILAPLQENGFTIRKARTPSEVADAPAGLSNAELAIAETGSIMLAENTLEARVVSMLTLTHFVLIHAQDLFPMLDDAGVRLQQLTKAGPEQKRYISLVTGPSRTADIERTLTIGVQGPKAVCVLFIEN